MAEAGSVWLRLQCSDLQCSVCMGHYSAPCTLPCGHTFCRDCIHKFWHDKSLFSCPICNRKFPERPELSKNTDLAALLEALYDQTPRNHDNCPQCTGPGATSLCLPCMAPLCPEHRALHTGSSPAPHRHLLVSLSTASWPCRSHERGVQHFCIAHSAPLCPTCVLQHQRCQPQPRLLLDVYTEHRDRLEKQIADLDESITSKEVAIGVQKNAYREIQILVCDMKDQLTQDFRDMRDYVEKQERASFWRMQQEQDAASKATSQEIQTLMANIDHMKKVKVELQDRIDNDWISVLKYSGSEVSSVLSSAPNQQYTFDVNRLVDTTDAISNIKKSLLSHPLLEKLPCPPKQVFEETLLLQPPPGPSAPMAGTRPPERSPNRLLQWATLISFDPQTVNNRLSLSEDLKTVTVAARNNVYEKNGRRFTISQVLCSQSFSSECCYWEFSTKDSHGWAVGVAAAEMGKDDKLGASKLSWCVRWSKERLCALHNNDEVPIHLPRPTRVGVLLDCQDKELKFYSISADGEILIHSYTVQIQSRIFPAVWLFGLKLGNSLTIQDLQRITL